MPNQYTKNELKEALPADLWDDVADYLNEIDARHTTMNLVGWGGGHRRIPHC